MIKRFFVLLSLIGIVSLPAQVPVGLQQEVAQANGRVIITLKDGREAKPARDRDVRISNVLKSNRGQQQRITARLRSSHGGMNIRGTLEQTAMIVADIQPSRLAEILADSNVAMVEPDRVWRQVETVNTVDRWAAYHKRAQETPYGIPQVTAPQAWALGYRGAGVKVAVLDSGIDTAHPDLVVVGGYDAVNRVESGYNDDLAVCNGHGTHIAGTIAGRDNDIGVIGVAPDVQLYAIKVFQDVGYCGAFTSTQINGLNWAVTKGIRLINISIGSTGQSFSMDAAMQAANAQGTYVLAAAGNSGGDMSYPGNSDYAIGIGAVDGSNNRASWSSYGPALDFVAPGVGITSTMPGGGYGGKSGTSMATPHAVGVAALILNATPTLTFEQLRQKLIAGVLDLEAPGFDNTTGNGLVRAYNSITAGTLPILATLDVAPAGARTTALVNATLPNGSTNVTFSGANGNLVSWIADLETCSGFICPPPPPQFVYFTNRTGTGNGTVSWIRSASGIAAGTYVNTFKVTATGALGSPKFFADTLTLTATPPPCTLGVNGSTSRTYQVAVAGQTVTDTITVTGTCAWTATSSRTVLIIQPTRIIFTASAADTIKVIKQ